MKLLTFNVRIDLESDGDNQWKNRLNSVAQVINEGEYDVIGLQEPNEKMLESLMNKCPAYRYTGSQRDEKNEMNPILYDTEKMRLLASETIWLSDNKEVPSKFSDSFFNRIATISIFEERRTFKMFRFVNTHLDYANDDVQKRQMEVLIKHLNVQTSAKRLPTIIIGDFNAGLNGKVHELLKEAKIAHSKLSSVYDGESIHATYHQFKGIKDGDPIDYVYFTNHFQKQSMRIITDKFFQVYPSDHFPVEFSLDFLN